MTADEAAFLQAICSNPEDDTVRMVFADWLDEHGNADRAEFIRVQCRQHTISPTGLNIPKESLHEWYELESRANELQRPEWAKCPCLACEALGVTGGGYCPVCDGTGDLLLRWGEDRGQAVHCEPRNPTFRRGFIDSVECRLSEIGKEHPQQCPDCAEKERRRRGPGGATIMRCGRCDGGVVYRFAPSPWARAVVTTLPVTRLRIMDREPYLSRYSTSAYYGWQNADATTRRDRECLPKWIFDMLGGFCEVACPPYLAKWYPTRDAALDALAVAAARVVRRAVYGS